MISARLQRGFLTASKIAIALFGALIVAVLLVESFDAGDPVGWLGWLLWTAATLYALWWIVDNYKITRR